MAHFESALLKTRGHAEWSRHGGRPRPPLYKNSLGLQGPDVWPKATRRSVPSPSSRKTTAANSLEPKGTASTARAAATSAKTKAEALRNNHVDPFWAMKRGLNGAVNDGDATRHEEVQVIHQRPAKGLSSGPGGS